MKLVRGFDRIALVIAVFISFPGFYIGAQLSGKLLKTEAREYRAWHKQYEEQKRKLEKGGERVIQRRNIGENKRVAGNNL